VESIPAAEADLLELLIGGVVQVSPGAPIGARDAGETAYPKASQPFMGQLEAARIIGRPVDLANAGLVAGSAGPFQVWVEVALSVGVAKVHGYVRSIDLGAHPSGAIKGRICHPKLA